MTEKLSYASSGVNIDAGEKAVNKIKPIVKKTFNKNIFGASKTVLLPQGIPNANTIFESGDIMVIYGKHDDINKLLDD